MVPPSWKGSGTNAVMEFFMKWAYSKFVEPDLGFSLFKLQSIVNASFGSGPLTAALLNLTAVALVTLVKHHLSDHLRLRSVPPCNG
tara:strand:+ start:569 stop:826 length:258 start_codon:yes stop_codon:yes gene_type:complete